jgi:hypothetical protein
MGGRRTSTCWLDDRIVISPPKPVNENMYRLAAAVTR